MTKDKILEVVIDDNNRLIVKPEKERFTFIYRTASEVHWDDNGHYLYSPKPREWTYVNWFRHIMGVIEMECNCKLFLTKETKWTNISESIKQEIIDYQNSTNSAVFGVITKDHSD
ncbi:MAG: hypothetical protein R2730_13120 [Chitinophagales bacterium]